MRRYKSKALFALILSAVLSLGTIGYAEAESTADTAAVQEETKTSDPTITWDDNWMIPAGISVGSVDFGNLTVGEARAKLDEKINVLLNRSIVADMNGKQYTSSAKDLGVTWANPQVFDEALGHMARGNFVVRYKNQKDLEAAPIGLGIQMSVPQEAVHNYVQSIVDAATVKPVEPTVKRVDGKFEPVAGQTGIAFDIVDIENQIMTQLADPNHVDTLNIQAQPAVTQPAIDPAIFTHFSEKPLGSWTTQFTDNEKNANRSSNVEASANNMDGHVVLPGEVVSTLAMYGNITTENGYKLAGTYLDGKVVDGIGGGICQTTSTLYNAVLLAELEVVYRRNHSMLVDYVQPGMDATVDYGSGSDFKFKNNTGYPIYIASYRKDNNVTVTIYGTETRPKNRTIQYESKILEWSYPETPENPMFSYDIDPTLPIGWAEVAQKQYTDVDCHPKVQAELYKNVYVDGNLTETIKIGNVNKYRYSGGKIYHAADCKVKAIDPNPGSVEKRKPYIECKFLDGVAVGPKPPAQWSDAQLAEHKAAMKKLMGESK